jgi:hypothetical protein
VKLINIFAGSLVVPLFLLTSAGAGAQSELANSSIEPFTCNLGTPATAIFTNFAHRLPLLMTLSPHYSEAGAVINLPKGTPANTVSFEVIATPASAPILSKTTGAIFVAGTTSGDGFFGGIVPQSMSGNRKRMFLNFNLQNLPTGRSALPNTTITSLFIGAFNGHTSKPGTIMFDNVVVNGQSVTTKIMTADQNACL